MTQPNPTTVRPTRTQPSQTNDDALAHIVMKDDQMRGYMTGEAIKALCGKVWVPTRDYEGLPVCPACVDERDRLIAGMKNLN